MKLIIAVESPFMMNFNEEGVNEVKVLGERMAAGIINLVPDAKVTLDIVFATGEITASMIKKEKISFS